MKQWYEMQCMSSLLTSNPTKRSEGCNHVAKFNVHCYTSTYCTNTRLQYLLMHTDGGCKKCNITMHGLHTSNFNIKRNTTIDDEIYSKRHTVNFIYQVIWLMWILKLTGGNSNNKWKRVDHGATFTCLL
jgi:hypothetical protein